MNSAITQADLDLLSQATLDLYSPELHIGNWVEQAFTFIRALVPADMVNYGNLSLRTGTMEATTTCDGLDWERAVTGFGAFMQKYEYFNFDPAVNNGLPFFRSDFISTRQFRDLDIYSECFRILETMDHAAVHVPTGDGRLAWFAAERGGSRDFDERDRMMLIVGQQHLTNSRYHALARQSVRDENPIEPSIFVEAGLTARESEIGYWLTEGKSNQEIAALLRLQVQTVKGYVATLFLKTGTGNRLALVLHLLELTRTLLWNDKNRIVLQVQKWPRRGKALKPPVL